MHDDCSSSITGFDVKEPLWTESLAISPLRPKYSPVCYRSPGLHRQTQIVGFRHLRPSRRCGHTTFSNTFQRATCPANQTYIVWSIPARLAIISILKGLPYPSYSFPLFQKCYMSQEVKVACSAACVRNTPESINKTNPRNHIYIDVRNTT